MSNRDYVDMTSATNDHLFEQLMELARRPNLLSFQSQCVVLEAANRLRDLDAQDNKGPTDADLPFPPTPEVTTEFRDSELLVIGMGLSWLFGYITEGGDERPMPSGVASNFDGLIEAIDRAKKRALSNAN